MGTCCYLRLKNLVLDLSNTPKDVDWFKLAINNFETMELPQDLAPEQLKHCDRIVNFSSYLLKNSHDRYFDHTDINNCEIDLVLSFKDNGTQMEQFVYYLKDKIKSGSIFYKFDDIEIQKLDSKNPVDYINGKYTFNYTLPKFLDEEDVLLIEREDVFEN